MWKKLHKLYIHTMRYCNLKLVFKSPVRIKSFSTFNDKLPKMLISWLFSNWKCGGCNATFSGKIKHHFKVQIYEHLDISHLIRKKVKIDNNNLKVIQENLLCYNYSPSFENFSILTSKSNNFKLKLMENLLIVHDKPVLKKRILHCLWGYFYITSVVTIYFITSHDAFLSHWMYAIFICLVFNIILQILVFYQKKKKNMYEHLILF